MLAGNYLHVLMYTYLPEEHLPALTYDRSLYLPLVATTPREVKHDHLCSSHSSKTKALLSE